MVIGKGGQAIVVGMMVAVVLLIFLMQIITPLKELAQEQRTNMDCGNTSISTGTKATCILIDWYTFYFIGMCLAAGVSFIIAKKAFE